MTKAGGFGNVTAGRERFREASRWTWLEQAAQDLRYATRGLRHSPAFVAGSVLGIVALALSVSGLYGVLVYLLGQRTREIGIRRALGATAGAVMRLVMWQSARLAGLGAIVGVGAALGVMKIMSVVIQLESISLFDVTAFAGGLGLVTAATALAAYYPARRATRVDPARTLRADG